MWVKRARLVNVGPHGDLAVDFERGLVALWGPNGCGKSTLVNAVYACLTNDWSRFPGDKGKAARDTSDPGDPAFAEVEAEHDGVAFAVRRDLRGQPAHRLRVPSERAEWLRDTEIREQLERRLGVDRRTVGAYVFVPQRGMLGWLDQSPAKRAETFHHLCKTGRAAAAHDAAGRAADGLAADPDAVDSADDLAAALEAARADAAAAQADLARVLPDLLSPGDLEYAERVLADESAADAVADQLPDAEDELAEAEAAAASALDRTAAAAEALRLAEADLAALRPAYEAAAAAREAAEALAAAGRRSRAARKARFTLTGERDRNPPPAPPARRCDPAALREEAAALRFAAARAREALRVFEEEGASACPTCGTPAAEGAFDAAAARAAVEAGRAAPGLEADARAEGDYRAALAAWETWSADWAARAAAADAEVAEAEAAEAALGPGPAGDPAGDADAYEDADGRRDEAAEALQRRRRAEAAALARFDAAWGARRRLRLREASLRRKPKTVAKAKALLDAHRAAGKAEAALAARLDAARAREADLAARLDAARALAARSAARRRAEALLRRFQDEVAHHSRLPRVVASGNLAAMEEDLNAELAEFGSPFWVEAGDDLGFLAHLPGQPARPAEFLSVGQRGVLATAFRWALASLFDADVGMLWLDEPTEGLDAANLGYMRDALARLAGRVRGRRQVVVVTHHEGLLPAFDQVVTL